MTQARPFSLAPPPHASAVRRILATALAPIEAACALRTMNDAYRHAVARMHEGAHFCNGVIDFARLAIDLDPADIRRIPPTGPLLVVANHPFGVVDGVVLHSILLRARRDVRLFGSTLLRRMEAYRPDFFFVDNFDTPDAPARNAGAVRAALRFLRDGGCLAVFPAGEVAHLSRRSVLDGKPSIADPPWNPTVAALARRARAAVLPVAFRGRNSTLFHLAGLLHPRLRTALLPAEFRRQRGATVTVRIGNVITPQRVQAFDSDEALSQHLRLRVELLRSAPVERPTTPAPEARPDAPVIAPPPVERVAREIDQLPHEQTLAETGSLVVLFARARQAPALLREIGRLREITFRAAGEGTGRAVDLDRFDDDYLHLFAWDRAERQVIGAYRLGLVDELIDRHGIDGLYTSTLFKISPRLLQQIGPAVELGRSFVRPERQRDFAPLMLLWRGIGRFVAARPRYRHLIGPVSISNDYASLSKTLLMRFLELSSADPALRSCVVPRRPPRRPARFRDIERSLNSSAVARLEDVDELVAQVESHRRGMPVLLRQYLKLNARLLAFNVDPDFGDVLDGLMLADLADVDARILRRFVGDEAADALLARVTPTRQRAVA